MKLFINSSKSRYHSVDIMKFLIKAYDNFTVTYSVPGALWNVYLGIGVNWNGDWELVRIIANCQVPVNKMAH